MELQHVNVKLFVDGPLQLDLEQVIQTFHRWTAEQSLDTLLIDVADYRHVPEGPGVVLVGHEVDYALDQAEGRWGLLYNRKDVVTGDARQQLSQAFRTAASVCQKLEAEFADAGLKFSRHEFQIVVNDRAIATNTAESFGQLEPDLQAFLQDVFGHADFSLSQDPEPRRRLTVNVKSEKPFEIPVSI